jgi:hypothetical protein
VNLVVRPKAAWALAAATVCLLARSAPPVDAHAGNADGSRPFVTGVEPEVGVVASAVFAGSWQLNLSVAGGQEASVLDESGRPFLRIGPDRVEGDYGAPAWYTSAVAPNAAGVVRLPDGIGPDTTADWRLVSRSRDWAWFDPRISAAPGAVTPDMVSKAVPVRLRDFSIPLRVGDRQAQIKGYLEFEPPRGRYLHRLLSPERPAPGVEVGLLAGQAVPTVTVRNDSTQAVTVLGATGEPFLRVGDDVEANLASPTWVQVSRSLGRIPKTAADPAAQPQWERIADGRLMSWTDFRSRPPDAEPPSAVLRAGRAVEVRRWTIPLRIAGQAAEIRGATAFEPFRRPSRHSNTAPVVAAAIALGLGAIAVLLRRTRASAEPPG